MIPDFEAEAAETVKAWAVGVTLRDDVKEFAVENNDDLVQQVAALARRMWNARGEADKREPYRRRAHGGVALRAEEMEEMIRALDVKEEK
jgi:hypothetical protein